MEYSGLRLYQGGSGKVVEEGCQARGLNGEDAEGHGGWSLISTLAILTIVVACEVLFNNDDDNTSTIFMVLS